MKINKTKIEKYVSKTINITQRDGSNFSERPAVKKALLKMFNYLDARLHLKKNYKLLDIGSGGGQISEIFCKKRELKYFGVTIDDNELKKAKIEKINVIKSDMHDIPYDDENFEIVYAAHVIEHSFSPIIALNEWYRVLKEKGYLIIWSPIGRDFKGKDDGTSVYGCKDHLITPTNWQYKWLFKITGFNILYEMDLPYQLTDKMQEIRYRILSLINTFFSAFGLSLKQELIPGTARLFILSKNKDQKSL
jgi:SAM-dependent methyltransferase